MSRGGMFDGGPPSNRFGPPGPGGNRGGGGGGPPMGMNRGGGSGGNGGPPQFGPRMGPTSPMFMRGQRPGPPGTMLPGPPGAAGMCAILIQFIHFTKFSMQGFTCLLV